MSSFVSQAIDLIFFRLSNYILSINYTEKVYFGVRLSPDLNIVDIKDPSSRMYFLYALDHSKWFS